MVEFTDEQEAALVAQIATAEVGLKFAAAEVLKVEGVGVTVCQSLVLSCGFANPTSNITSDILNTKLA